MPLDGAATRVLAASEVNDAPVQWTVDSRALLVYRPGEIPARVFQLSLDGGRRTLWKGIPPADASASGISTLLLSRDGQVGVYGYQVQATDLYLVRGLR